MIQYKGQTRKIRSYSKSIQCISEVVSCHSPRSILLSISSSTSKLLEHKISACFTAIKLSTKFMDIDYCWSERTSLVESTLSYTSSTRNHSSLANIKQISEMGGFKEPSETQKEICLMNLMQPQLNMELESKNNILKYDFHILTHAFRVTACKLTLPLAIWRSTLMTELLGRENRRTNHHKRGETRFGYEFSWPKWLTNHNSSKMEWIPVNKDRGAPINHKMLCL